MKNYIKIHPQDNVAVALCPLTAASDISLEEQQIHLLEDIPQGHKFALTDIPAVEECL